MTIQTSLSIQVSQKTVLVDLHTMRAMLNLDDQTLLNGIDDGTYTWAWNIAVKEDKVRTIRFWARYLFSQPSATTIEEVVNCLVPPHREMFRGNELKHLLLCSGATVQRLSKELDGVVVGHTLKVPAASLRRFFTSRWLGAIQHNTHNV